MPDFSDFLITTDFDRTLTAPDATIPRQNLDAIRFFMEHGGAFTVNTGRSLAMFRKYMREIPVNAPLLLYNGSAAYDPETGTFPFCHLIDLNMAETVRECMALFPDMVVEIQGTDAHYTFRPNPMWEAFCRANECRARITRPEDDIGPFIKMTVYGGFHAPTVSHLFQAAPEELARCDAVESSLRRRYGSKVEIFRSGARILDVHAKGVSKIQSARALQKALNRKYLVCIGDAENDIAMLRGADFSYCPADGIIAGQFETVCECAQGAVADVIFRKIPQLPENHP